jgi:hypothetical protein
MYSFNSLLLKEYFACNKKRKRIKRHLVELWFANSQDSYEMSFHLVDKILGATILISRLRPYKAL